ncbi:MAG: protein-L-isoaspartate(D-aspartate) O-methyltransferase, partial [Pseudomonadota bacterium]
EGHLRWLYLHHAAARGSDPPPAPRRNDPIMGELNDDPFQAARLILTLRREGVTDPNVLRAVEAVPRSAFIEPELAGLAYEDCVLPIGCGQTLERPSTLAAMIQLLRLQDVSDPRILIVGCGSGYTAALVAEFTETVFAMERFRRLADRAVQNYQHLGIESVSVRHGDGLLGWVEAGPFDRILLTGSVSEVPSGLLSQLSDGGLCIAPIAEGETQSLVVLDKNGIPQSSEPTHPHTPLMSGVSKAL